MKLYKLILVGSTFLLPYLAEADSKATISGSNFKIIEIAPESNTGLNNIFVVRDASGCIFNFKAVNGYTAKIYKYSNLGGGYAEEIVNVDREASSISFPLGKEDLGYIIEEGSSRYYCWIVNYANHIMTLSHIFPSSDIDCDYSVLNIEGNASPINYYTINGQPKVLSREIYINYTTQIFDKTINDFMTTDEQKVYESLGSVVSISPPAFSPTYFLISGDRFLREWGQVASAETGLVQPTAVNCAVEAVQEFSSSEEGSNIMGSNESSGLGGSAPADINFYAYTTDGVIHYEWQMSRNENFDNPDYRFYQKDLNYTFTDEGTFYLRFIGSNADGTCETFGDTFTVNIGASALECPNAFSPNGDGINDIWKVSYRSLLDFHCEIFNRNGQKIYAYDDPSGGWDGTWHGKTVRPGVYYYVIVATGADGQKYKKSGDINIIRSVIFGPGGNTGSSGEETTEGE